MDKLLLILSALIILAVLLLFFVGVRKMEKKVTQSPPKNFDDDAVTEEGPKCPHCKMPTTAIGSGMFRSCSFCGGKLDDETSWKLYGN